MWTIQNTLLFLSVMLTALIAGLFYSWTCSVIPGLSGLSNSDYIRAMQHMNRAIVNPVFMLSFLGTLIVLPIACFYSHAHADTACFGFLLAATLLYVVSFGITVGCNVPLNDSLAAFDLSSASPEQVSVARKAFESPWNNYHLARTLASVASLACTILALIKK